ncbi:hypothetical protein MLD38_015153 [Melastoma candidum]|uniref:Uncharacterized protein n=1 Tax=Melastoma candidum TaxID=119954 RepID=A0ACB9RET9_9MYRT|nr:hypothetical protein MLD38_015153 [Melastoma candidum]
MKFSIPVTGSGTGLGSVTGPTAAAAAAAAQKQKVLLQRVDMDIGNIIDNFSQLVTVARVNEPLVRNSQEAFMMEMRAARMVQAADSLLKLVSELKQTAIFSGRESKRTGISLLLVRRKNHRTSGKLKERGRTSTSSAESNMFQYQLQNDFRLFPEKS